jgi:hypothetical protein
MNQLSVILDQLSPAVRVWVALTLTIAGLVLTAVGTVRSDATLSAVGAALVLAGGIVTPSGSGRPPAGSSGAGLPGLGVALVLLAGCGPAVTLGQDAVRTTCDTCRRIQPACDAVSPAPSASASVP